MMRKLSATIFSFACLVFAHSPANTADAISPQTKAFLQDPTTLDQYGHGSTEYYAIKKELHAAFEKIANPLIEELQNLRPDMPYNPRTPSSGLSKRHNVQPNVWEMTFRDNVTSATGRQSQEYFTIYLEIQTGLTDDENAKEDASYKSWIPGREGNSFVVHRGYADIINIGPSNKGQVTWGKTQPGSTVKWRTRTHEVEVRIFDKSKVNQREEALAFAHKVDTLLKKYGFYDFPYSLVKKPAKLILPPQPCPEQN